MNDSDGREYILVTSDTMQPAGQVTTAPLTRKGVQYVRGGKVLRVLYSGRARKPIHSHILDEAMSSDANQLRVLVNSSTELAAAYSCRFGYPCACGNRSFFNLCHGLRSSPSWCCQCRQKLSIYIAMTQASAEALCIYVPP